MIAWKIWKRRNRKIFEDELIHPDLEADKVVSFLDDFKQQIPNQEKQKQS